MLTMARLQACRTHVAHRVAPSIPTFGLRTYQRLSRNPQVYSCLGER